MQSLSDLLDVAGDIFPLGGKGFEVAAGTKHFSVSGQHNCSDLRGFVTAVGDLQELARHFQVDGIAVVGAIEPDQSNAVFYFEGEGAVRHGFSSL